MNARFRRIACASLLLGTLGAAANAKPIAYADGTTIMAEYGAGTMTEVQGFYAPTYRYSVGGGHLSLNSEVNDDTRDITYLRLNYLPKRWNFERAQANVFVWGSAGRAHISDGEDQFAWNVGGQMDYETRRVYASLRTDLHEGSDFSHRIDTLQLGLAPTEHDYDKLAVWLVVQARNYDDGLFRGVEWAGLIRLFKHNAWFEAGATAEGRVQAMLMFNF